MMMAYRRERRHLVPSSQSLYHHASPQISAGNTKTNAFPKTNPNLR
jgi:hypothetical protein